MSIIFLSKGLSLVYIVKEIFPFPNTLKLINSPIFSGIFNKVLSETSKTKFFNLLLFQQTIFEPIGFWVGTP